ncbi:hypothetical protein T492DRAFT_963255, partial [Pavlovales sp. CCMP2436]
MMMQTATGRRVTCASSLGKNKSSSCALRVALNHACRGALASLRYYAAGSAECDADLIVGAVSAFGVGERVLGKLEALVPERAASGDDAAETALYIMSRAREVLSELKECQTETQRGEYYAALCVLSPEAVVERETEGMGRRVKAALGLHRSNAVIDECRKIRAAFDASWFDRHAADSEGMHFVEWDSVAAGNDPDARFVLNATE